MIFLHGSCLGGTPKATLVRTHKILSRRFAEEDLIVQISIVELHVDAFASTAGTDMRAVDLSSHSADATLAAGSRALTSGRILVRRRWICRQVTLSAQILSPSPKGLAVSVLIQSPLLAY